MSKLLFVVSLMLLIPAVYTMDAASFNKCREEQKASASKNLDKCMIMFRFLKCSLPKTIFDRKLDTEQDVTQLTHQLEALFKKKINCNVDVVPIVERLRKQHGLGNPRRIFDTPHELYAALANLTLVDMTSAPNNVDKCRAMASYVKHVITALKVNQKLKTDAHVKEFKSQYEKCLRKRESKCEVDVVAIVKELWEKDRLSQELQAHPVRGFRYFLNRDLCEHAHELDIMQFRQSCAVIRFFVKCDIRRKSLHRNTLDSAQAQIKDIESFLETGFRPYNLTCNVTAVDLVQEVRHEENTRTEETQQADQFKDGYPADAKSIVMCVSEATHKALYQVDTCEAMTRYVKRVLQVKKFYRKLRAKKKKRKFQRQFQECLPKDEVTCDIDVRSIVKELRKNGRSKVKELRRNRGKGKRCRKTKRDGLKPLIAWDGNEALYAVKSESVGKCLDKMTANASRIVGRCVAMTVSVKRTLLAKKIYRGLRRDEDVREFKNQFYACLPEDKIFCDMNVTSIVRELRENDENEIEHTTTKPNALYAVDSGSVGKCLEKVADSAPNNPEACLALVSFVKQEFLTWSMHTNVYPEHNARSVRRRMESELYIDEIKCNLDIMSIARELQMQNKTSTTGPNGYIYCGTVDECSYRFSKLPCENLSPYIKYNIRVHLIHNVTSLRTQEDGRNLNSSLQLVMRQNNLKCNFTFASLVQEVREEDRAATSKSGSKQEKPSTEPGKNHVVAIEHTTTKPNGYANGRDREECIKGFPTDIRKTPMTCAILSSHLKCKIRLRSLHNDSTDKAREATQQLERFLQLATKNHNLRCDFRFANLIEEVVKEEKAKDKSIPQEDSQGKGVQQEGTVLVPQRTTTDPVEKEPETCDSLNAKIKRFVRSNDYHDGIAHEDMDKQNNRIQRIIRRLNLECDINFAALVEEAVIEYLLKQISG